jgi:hypothetical protein
LKIILNLPETPEESATAAGAAAVEGELEAGEGTVK